MTTWWFHLFLVFTPTPGEWSNLTIFWWNGLKPPPIDEWFEGFQQHTFRVTKAKYQSNSTGQHFFEKKTSVPYATTFHKMTADLKLSWSPGGILFAIWWDKIWVPEGTSINSCHLTEKSLIWIPVGYPTSHHTILCQPVPRTIAQLGRWVALRCVLDIERKNLWSFWDVKWKNWATRNPKKVERPLVEGGWLVLKVVGWCFGKCLLLVLKVGCFEKTII